jgi:hypothetical protein
VPLGCHGGYVTCASIVFDKEFVFTLLCLPKINGHGLHAIDRMLQNAIQRAKEALANL